MPGRKFSGSNNYRYGFNGKENDNEVVGTGQGTQDYGLRIYNPALGKFLSVDPLTKQYPYKTPYDFAENSPIENIDLDGGEKKPYWAHLYASNGNSGLAIISYGVDWLTSGLSDIVEGGHEIADAKMDNTKKSGYTENVSPETRSLIMKGRIMSGEVQMIKGAIDFSEKMQYGMMAAGMGVSLTGANPYINNNQASYLEKASAAISNPKNVKITYEGVAVLKAHLKRFNSEAKKGYWEHNEMMIKKLEQIQSGGAEATETELLFYSHEIREMQYMQKGMKYKDAHNQSLKDFNTTDDKLYTPEALKAFDKQCAEEAGIKVK